MILAFITFVFLKCSQKYKKLIKLAFLKRNHRKDKSNFQNSIVFLSILVKPCGRNIETGRKTATPTRVYQTQHNNIATYESWS